MFRPVTKLVSTAIATLVLVGVSSALSSVPYRERSAGTLTDVTPGHLSLAGVGRATYFGSYSLQAANDFDEVGNVFNGHVTLTTADDSTITGIYSGSYAPLSSGKVRLEVTVTWTSGTRRLEGLTGEAEVVALVDGVAPGAAFQAQGFGNLVL